MTQQQTQPSEPARTYADHVATYALAGWPCKQLPCGRLTVVDPVDSLLLEAHDWRATADGYVRATVDGTRTFLHRLVLRAVAGQVVDHINHDVLDNRRSNLRLCTAAQNRLNKQVPANNTSGYKGVVWRPSRRKWEAAIQPKGRARFLGRFDDPWDAAQAYNAAALELFGEFAHLNVKLEAAQ